MHIEHIDRKANPPTLKTSTGEAWEIDLPRARALANETDETDSTVAFWVVFAPWAHSLWAYYLVGAIHLRPSLRLPQPKILLPGATHEVIVYALTPDVVPNVVDTSKLEKLRPVNFAGQWRVTARPNPVDLDRAAAEKIKFHVGEILAGVLSPDTDFRRQWVERFSNSNIR